MDDSGISGSTTVVNSSRQQAAIVSLANAVCTVCGAAAQFMCSSCQLNSPVRYCSRECQRQHWPEHQLTCQGAVRRTPQNLSENLGLGGNVNRSHNSLASQLNAETTMSTDGLIRNQGYSGVSIPDRSRRAEEGEQSEEERLEEFKFYLFQVYTIIKPVLLCIVLSILWVKLSNPVSPFYDTGTMPVAGISTSIGQSFGTTGSDSSSVITAFIVLGQIVVATVVIAVLFHYGKIMIIYGIFGVIVTILLGFFGYSLGVMLLTVANAPMDWISFMFCLWNLVVVGVLVIFWKGPRLMQQAYLVLMSSMMAFSLSSLPSLVTWILLGLLAVWDLVAVLCPYGPLRLMIESARRNNQEIPAALIYSAMVWMMASGPESSPIRTRNDESGNPFVRTSQAWTPQSAARTSRSIELQSIPHTNQNNSHIMRQQISPQNVDSSEESVAIQQQNAAPRVEESPPTQPDDDDEESGLKLGLGDFVFYSVLVGRASLYDWITTLTTMVAVTTGLTMTIFLLAVYRKPLPALPISIAFGILFFLVSSITLTPFANNLVKRPDRIVINGTDSGLWVGKGDGAGFTFP